MAVNNYENNSFLYFAVGALLVAVAVFGFIYLNDEDLGTDNTMVINTEAPDNTPDVTRSELNLNVDEDGINASSERSE